MTTPRASSQTSGPPPDAKFPRDAWLIVAWAASGDARDAAIAVPGLGQVTVRARPAGSVYLAAAKAPVAYEPPVVTLDLLDRDAMDPTARWR